MHIREGESAPKMEAIESYIILAIKRQVENHGASLPFDYEYDSYGKPLLSSETGMEPGCGPLTVVRFPYEERCGKVYSMIYRHQGQAIIWQSFPKDHCFEPHKLTC